MNNGTARAIGLLSVLLLPTGCFAAHAGAPAAKSGALQKQLRHTRAELQSQRTQTDQLRARVKDLEKTSATDRAALEQRDREIRELRRKLAALPAAAHSAPIRPAGH